MTSKYRLMDSHCESQIRDVLRNTLRVLCANTIPYTAQLAVKALIGITVDESEVILIDIHEKCEKSVEPDGQQMTTDNNATLPDDYCESDFDHCQAVDSSQFVDHQGMLSDVIEIEDDDREFDVSQNINGIKTEGSSLYVDDNSFTGMYETKFSAPDDCFSNALLSGSEAVSSFASSTLNVDCKQSVFDLVSSCKAEPSHLKGAFYCRLCNKSFSSRAIYLKHRQRHQTSASRIPATGKLDYQYQDQAAEGFTGGIGDCSQGLPASNTSRLMANEKGTFYTCSICGQVVSHLSSFMRHKRKHEGIVYKCDICGTVVSRADALKVHRRKCDAKRVLGLI